MPDEPVFVAITSGTAQVDGKSIKFTQGKTFLTAAHPLFKECPTYFQVVGEFLRSPVEGRKPWRRQGGAHD